MMQGETWAIVLAAGDGTRLRSIAIGGDGVSVPKQFLAFGRPQSLLRNTLDRARTLVGDALIVPVVAAGHERWWRRELVGGSLENVVVQPRNAGTAPGLLLPLLEILRRDKAATVVVLPSDHHVDDEVTFAAELDTLVVASREDPSHVILLCMVADAPETQYGWIVPSMLSDGLTHAVDEFVEKPTPAEAARLRSHGGLWSTFVMAGPATALEDLFELATPSLAWRFLRHAAASSGGAVGLDALYDGLVSADFSRDVLQQPACRRRLRVLPARPCGWSDLGTPDRVAKAFGQPQAPLAAMSAGRMQVVT